MAQPLPKLGEKLATSFYGYWSLEYGCLYVTENKSQPDPKYLPVFGPTPVEFEVTFDPHVELNKSFDEARKEAERKFHETVANLNRIQAQYLAIEMSPRGE